MSPDSHIRAGQTTLSDSIAAVRAFHCAVHQTQMALVVFFCSRSHDLDVVAREMARLFGTVPVVGCTSAGEIGPVGYTEHALSGFSLGQRAFQTAVGCIEDVRGVDLPEGRQFVADLQQRLHAQPHHSKASNHFALMLIDGLTMREERVTRAIQTALGHVPLLGGSAADGMDFQRTEVYANGQFGTGRAVVLLIATALPVQSFKIQHFVPTAQRLVVTEADAPNRLVKEINGRPAAQAYADLIGVDIGALDATQFAAAPLMVLIDGSAYIRSIQKANPDGSLTFFCAIEEGMVLRVARGCDLLGNMRQSFNDIRHAIGEPLLTIAFDCILRKLENIRTGCADEVADVFRANRAVGLNTYGEQYCGVHVTQTLTGVAIGAPRG